MKDQRLDAARVRRGAAVFFLFVRRVVGFISARDVGFDAARDGFDCEASLSGSSYASRSHSVIGGSTSSRCRILMMFATLLLVLRSARCTCGALTARPRKMLTSSHCRFG